MMPVLPGLLLLSLAIFMAPETAAYAQAQLQRSDTGTPAPAPNATIVNAVSVTDFGAKGDGTTDDWTAVQKAVDAVSALGHGTVTFPSSSGCYRLSQALRMKSGVQIHANGATICGTSDAAGNYSRFPSGGVMTFGVWGAADIAAMTRYALNPANVGDRCVTTSTANQAGSFATGDVVLLGSESIWAIAGGNIPTQGQVNVVTSASVATGTICLRHSIDIALTTPPKIGNLSNSGLTWSWAPGGDSGNPQWAVRDCGVYGGTWTSKNMDMPFLIGGAIDCTIDVERIESRNGAYYGNLGANIKFRVGAAVGKSAGVEVALLSHNNDIEVGTLTFASSNVADCVLGRGRNAIWVNEGARDNRIHVRRIESRDGSLLRIVRYQNAARNKVTVDSALVGTTCIAVAVEDQKVSGTRPPTTSNITELTSAQIGTISSAGYYTSNNGAGSANALVNSRILGPNSGAAIYFDNSATGDGVSDSYFESGVVSHGEAPSGVYVHNSYVGGGLKNSAASFLSGMSVRGLTQSPLHGNRK